MSYSIPLMRPVLPSADRLLPYLQRIDQAQHYTNFGPLQSELRERLCRMHRDAFGRDVHGVCTSSATLGLELALSSLGLPKGAKVGVPALTFIATATAVLRAGHVPVVLDVDPDAWLLTPAIADAALSKGLALAAVLPVAAFGMPQDAQAWARWHQKTGVAVVIDAAGAIGAQATAPDVTVVFSLHATKPLSAGEGGLVLTEDAALAQRLSSLTNFGIGHPGVGVGSNAKLSEYHAAIGLADADVWPVNAQARMSLRQHYLQKLQRSCGAAVSFQQDTGIVAPSIFPIRLQTAAIREGVEQRCERAGLQTRRWYAPLIHQQKTLGTVEVAGPMPHAEHLEQTLLGLPFFLGMSEADVDQVVRVICEALPAVQENRV